MFENRIFAGNNLDTLKKLPDNYVNCCVTSPPYYGLRDYGTAQWEGGDPECNHFRDNKIVENATFSSDTIAKGNSIYKSVCKKCGARREDYQIGLEETPELYIERLVEVFREVKRVLRNDGTLWVNIGDSYAGSGKGGSPNSSKQSSNKGSQSVGNIYGKTDEAAQRAAAINVTKKTFEGIKQKDLIGIPWMLAFALRTDGWYLRQSIIWAKPSPMPESVKDRFCKSHEYIFLLSKEKNYYFDQKHALEPATGYDGRNKTYMKDSTKYAELDNTGEMQNSYAAKGHERWPSRGNNNELLRTKRDVWIIPSEPSDVKHFAMFPQKLILPCILCGCPENGIVLDPFLGSGTTALVAIKLMRKYIGCEINPDYIKLAEKRIINEKGLFDV